MQKQNNPIDKKRIEDFLFSDSVPATTTKFLLMFLALGGLVVAGAVIPGILKAMDGRKIHKRKINEKRRIERAWKYLKKEKLIEILNEKDGKATVQLTDKGIAKVRRFSMDTITIRKPEKWDGKWRIVTFDIPTKPKIYNLAREALRQKIKELGFFQLQKSVWVLPFECEDEILYIAESFEVRKFVAIITAERLLHQKNLKLHFSI